MAVTPPWTPADTQTLTDLHAQGLPLGECATRMGRSKATISKWSERAGLLWDRSKTKAATQAKVADCRARRVALELGELIDAERFRAQMFVPTIVFNFGGRDNTYNEHLLDRPPIIDQFKLQQSVGNAIDRSLKLALHDADMGSVAAVDRWLTHMTEGEVLDGGSAPDREGA